MNMPWIKKCIDEYSNSCPEFPTFTKIMAQNEVSALNEHFKGIEWVNVKERLPNFNGRVIACINGKDVIGCSFNNDAKQFFHVSELKNVTHWMPLPKQPELYPA